MEITSPNTVDAIRIAGHGMRAYEEGLAVSGQNLVNLSTPGYKRLAPLYINFESTLARVAKNQPQPMISVPYAVSAARRDGLAGAVRFTGRPLDVAVEGNGVFEIQAADGIAYTRRGDFTVDERGRLVTHQGFPVMGLSGEIAASGTLPLHITRNGEVRQGERLLDTLKLVNLGDNAVLEDAGNGLYRSQGAATPLAETEVQLRTGHLEASNVDAAQEMIRLMGTLRQFEALSRVVQMSDESLEKAIRKLGDL